MKKFLALILALSMTFALVSCGGGGGEAGGEGGEIVIGNLLPLSGTSASLGLIGQQARDMAVEEINAAVKRVIPKPVFDVSVKLKDGFLDALFKYMRSYLLLLVITFLEMLTGLFLVRAPYPVIMAVVIALLDLLPVLGVGVVLIPWGIWSFLIGEGAFGIGLLVLFIAHTVFRQVIEPKIVGKSLGVHPLLTLVFIYVGYSVFGIVGLLLVPIFTVLVDIILENKKQNPDEKSFSHQ